MIEFLLGIVAGFTVTAIAAGWLCNSITGAFTQIMTDQSATICRMREEIRRSKQSGSTWTIKTTTQEIEPLPPGWDREWRNN